MSDLSDMNDIDRFMRCETGQRKLGEIRSLFVGKAVAEVEFSNEIHAVGVTLTFASGEAVALVLPELMLDALKEEFRAEIREEYYRDYPERRPKRNEGKEEDEGTDEPRIDC